MWQNEVHDFLASLDPLRLQLVSSLGDLMGNQLELTCKLRYKVPFFYRHSWICYLNPIKPHGIEWVFIHGKQLTNTHGLLDHKDRKQVSGITMTAWDNNQTDLYLEILHEALILDEFLHGK
ncbi:MAG: hypothetical protein AAFQ83_09230 [Bacteroidota bacterium]